MVGDAGFEPATRSDREYPNQVRYCDGEMVGDAGFEPATPWTQTKCATKLRQSPTFRTSWGG